MEFSLEIIIGAFSVLSSAIVYMFKLIVKNHRKLSKKLDECETKHQAANEKIIELSEKVGVLTGVNQLHDDIVGHIQSTMCNNCNGNPQRIKFKDLDKYGGENEI
jgi:uncharacterized protein YoxC